jgi:hypothetical protein
MVIDTRNVQVVVGTTWARAHLENTHYLWHALYKYARFYCLLLFGESQAYAVAKAMSDGLTFIPPYDDPHTISGQGTIGDEIMRQVVHFLSPSFVRGPKLVPCHFLCTSLRCPGPLLCGGVK